MKIINGFNFKARRVVEFPSHRGCDLSLNDVKSELKKLRPLKEVLTLEIAPAIDDVDGLSVFFNPKMKGLFKKRVISKYYSMTLVKGMSTLTPSGYDLNEITENEVMNVLKDLMCNQKIPNLSTWKHQTNGHQKSRNNIK